jgi:hypothetical protein
MERRAFKLPQFAGLYEITEDGQIFSIRKQRFLKPQVNSQGYAMYMLTPHKSLNMRAKWSSAHRMVAFNFIGDPPTRWHTDCHHKDHDKTNNHYKNLEWVTHSENILRSYKETDRVGPRLGKKYGPHSPETIALMRTAKEKGVIAEFNGEVRDYKSIQDLLDDLGIYRKAFNRSVKSGNPYNGITFSYKN